MQTFITILSGLWTLIRNVPVAIRYLPQIIALIGKIKEAFQADKVQEVFRMVTDLINSVAPTTKQQDNTGNSIGDTEEDKSRRRFIRFRNRMIVADNLTDKEAEEFCAQHHLSHITIA